jgi:hypothetical protein
LVAALAQLLAQLKLLLKATANTLLMQTLASIAALAKAVAQLTLLKLNNYIKVGLKNINL